MSRECISPALLNFLDPRTDQLALQPKDHGVALLVDSDPQHADADPMPDHEVRHVEQRLITAQFIRRIVLIIAVFIYLTKSQMFVLSAYL